MNKSQQMRWSRNGTDLLLQVRCAVYNGTLGAGFACESSATSIPHNRSLSALHESCGPTRQRWFLIWIN